MSKDNYIKKIKCDIAEKKTCAEIDFEKYLGQNK